MWGCPSWTSLSLLCSVTLPFLSFLCKAKESGLVSSVAWAASMGRASSQRGANECTISEDYSHTWSTRHGQGATPTHPPLPALFKTLSSNLHKPAFPSLDILPKAPSGPEFLLLECPILMPQSQSVPITTLWC